MHALGDEKDRKTFPFVVLANKIDMFDRRVVRICCNVTIIRTNSNEMLYRSPQSKHKTGARLAGTILAILKRVPNPVKTSSQHSKWQ
jgi:hypothetical protein